MEYEQPCRFPADDPNRLWMVVAGRYIPYVEAKRWYAALHGKRKALPLVAFILCLFFALATWSFTMLADISDVERAGAVATVLLGVAGFSTAVGILLGHPTRTVKRKILEYDADRKRHFHGARIAVYTDRITVTTVRGVRTLPFSDVEICLETRDGFLLVGGGTYIVIRSMDLTEGAAQFLREYLTERLPNVMHRNGYAMAQQYQAIPVPQCSDESHSLTKASIPLNTAEPYIRDKKRRFLLLLLMTLSLMLQVGVMTAVSFAVTPYFFADMAIFCVGWLVLGAAACGPLFKLFERRCTETVEFSFEPDGLRVTIAGEEHFIVKERLWLEVTADGVTLQFNNKTQISIPATAVENMFVLKMLAGVDKECS